MLMLMTHHQHINYRHIFFKVVSLHLKWLSVWGSLGMKVQSINKETVEKGNALVEGGGGEPPQNQKQKKPNTQQKSAKTSSCSR